MTSQDLPFDTETELLEIQTPHHIKHPRHLSQDINIASKIAIKIKFCSPLDASSNLEFTQKTRKSKSFANVRPNHQSFSVHKAHRNPSHSRVQVYQLHNKPPTHQTEKEPYQRTNDVLKEISDNQSEIPLYKIWPGNNRFYFEGRLMTGPETDKLPNSIAWLFVISVNILFFGAALPFLADQLTSLLPFLSSYLCISTVAFFLLTSFTDPGIIPRKCIWELNGAVPKPYCGPPKKDHSGHTGIFHRKMAEDSLEFCTICQIYKPPKAVHCKHCGNCVEVFGGHLRIFNNCIGKRNYRFFVGLITSMVLLIVFYVICFVVLMIQSFRDDIGIGPAAEPGNGTGFADKTANIVIGALVVTPTTIFFAIKLVLLCCYLKNKKQKQADQERKEGLGTVFKGISTDWCDSEPSKVNSRELLTRTQLQKYKATLVEGQQNNNNNHEILV